MKSDALGLLKIPGPFSSKSGAKEDPPRPFPGPPRTSRNDYYCESSSLSYQGYRSKEANFQGSLSNGPGTTVSA